MMEKNMIGKRFGFLTVIEKADKKNIKTNRLDCYWICQCDCGNKKIVNGHDLRWGNTKSCGCYGKEKRSKRSKKHGMKNTRIYRIWRGIKTRCYNKNFKHYDLYGGRGIVVCDDWVDKKNGSKNFIDWALKNGYEDNLTIDRIDVNGNYEPSNCRWTTSFEQANNRRNTIKICFDGQIKTIKEWSEITNIPCWKIRWREKNGWNPSLILKNKNRKEM